MPSNLPASLANVPRAFDRLVQDLGALVAIPSVSGDQAHRQDCRRAAAWIQARLSQFPGAQVQAFETSKNPIVLAHVPAADPQAPTLLIYAHYDVQTAQPLEDWDSDPFEPRLADDYLYARGATDMKGPFLTTVAALEAIAAAGPLPLHLKFLVEGNEETDPRPLRAFVADHKDLLSAEACLNVDAGMLGPHLPAITYGLRGSSNCTVRLFGPAHDLHDGTYGGVVENPIHVLARLIAGLQDERGRITLPGFYDRVRPIDEPERALLSQIPQDEAFFLRASGAPALLRDDEFSPVERAGARPSMNVRWIQGGAPKNAIPSQAAARISFRLVPDQDPREIHAKLLDHLESTLPPTVRWEVVDYVGSRGALVDRQAPAVQALAHALRETWGRDPLFSRSGGGIPVVGLLQEALGLDTTLTGFSLPGDNAHGPNERVHLPTLRRGVEALVRFFFGLAGQPP